MSRKFTFIALATTAALAMLWGGLFYLELGTQTAASYARCENVRFKRELGQHVSGPKLVVVAGSSTARGINAEILSRITGVQTINFGLFAGVGPDIVLYEARRVLRPGDIALLALEYNHYVYPGPTADAIDYVLGCGREYFRELPPTEKLRYVFGLGFGRIYQSLMLDSRAMAREIDQSNLTPRGDMRLVPAVFPGLSQQDQARMSLYRPIPIAVDLRSDGARTIAAFVAWAKLHGVAVLATWPNTIYFPQYDHARGFSDLRRFYDGLGVKMVGDASSSLLPLSMFYNTQYHLNIEGIRMRSQQLAVDLLKVLPSTERSDLRTVTQ